MAESEEPAAPASPPTQLVVDFAVEMKTRDGVRLMADVYRPAGPGLHTKTIPELGTLDEAVTAELTVRHGAQYPSRIVLRTAPDTPGAH